MSNPPQDAGQGPPLDATNALLAGLFQIMTDGTSIMPMPTELLQFVSMHNPRIARQLYHLRQRDYGSHSGLGGPQVREFMQNWTPLTPDDVRGMGGMGGGMGGGGGTMRPPRGARHAAGPNVNVTARPGPIQPGARANVPNDDGPSMPARSRYSPSRRSSSISSSQDPRLFHAVVGDRPASAGTGASAGSRAGTGTGTGTMHTVARPTTRERVAPVGRSEDVVMTNGPDDRDGRPAVVLPSISQFLQDIPAPMTLPVPAAASARAPTPAGSELSYQWVVLSSTVTATAPPTYPAIFEGTGDDEDPVEVPNDEPLTVSDMVFASGMYPEWNAMGIAFQLIVGHLDRGHLEPAGAGFVEVLDYMIRNGRALGIVPQSVYRGTGRAVALRDVRNFWSQFYYFARYVLTEQLLRTKAIRSILADRAAADAAATGATDADKPPESRIIMGPEMWFSFGGYLDDEWSAYFQHLFPKQALPAYLVPWFALANVRFVSYTDAELRAEDEARAARMAAARARAAAAAAIKTEADDDEKENEAPAAPAPDLMSYDMVSAMQDRVRILRRIMYPSDDKPTQGESDNFLPQMFYDKLLSLSFACSNHYPWMPSQQPVHLGLYRLGLDERKTHMDPVEYYGAAL